MIFDSWLQNNSNIVTVAGVAIIICVVTYFVIYDIYWKKRRHIDETIGKLNVFFNRILENQQKSSVDRFFKEELQKSESKKYQRLLLLFKNSLVEYVEDGSDIQKYCNSKCAEDFFNEHSLAGELLDNRPIVPSILTGLGVLGTFIGLVIMLYEMQDISLTSGGMSVSDDGAGNAASAFGFNDPLRILGGAWTAFFTSIAGIIASIVSNCAFKVQSSRVVEAISDLQFKIDNIFPPNISNDNALLKLGVRENSVQWCIKTMEKSIVESLKQTSRESAVLLADSITKYIADVNREAQQEAINQMARVLGSALNRYTEELKKSAEEFERITTNVSVIVKDSYDRMAAKFEEMTDGTLSSIGSISSDIRTWSELSVKLGESGSDICSRLDEIIDRTSDSLKQCSEVYASMEGIQKNMANNLISLQKRSDDNQVYMDKFMEQSSKLHEIFALLENNQKMMQQVVSEMKDFAPEIDVSLKENLREYTRNVNNLTRELAEKWKDTYVERAKHYEDVASKTMDYVTRAFKVMSDIHDDRE